jgi:UDPglucose 6-dehydrogenase
MNVSIIGTGYVGLVTGVCLAEKGHRVVCVDVDPEKVDRISRGEAPIHEPGLDELLERHVGKGLTATTDLAAAVRETEISLISVGTPFDGERKDLSFVEAVARELGRALADLDRYHVVLVKSTVPPGTTDDLVRPVLEEESGKRAGADFGVGMNPEFLREGEAVGDFLDPDRLVLGALDDRTYEVMEALYAGFPGVDRLRVSNRTAEMAKYASNSLLATLISFSNEIANLSAVSEGVDVVDVLRAVHLDRRVSPILASGERIRPGLVSYLGAGCGYGGSCFPKDVKGLVAHAAAAGVAMPVLESVIRTNQEQPREMLRLLRKHFDTLEGLEVTVLGLAFKPGTDDMRESPAIPIIQLLEEEGARVRAFDPVAGDEARRRFQGNGVRICDTLPESVEGAQAVLLVTRWPEFEGLPSLLENRGEPPVVVDGRRMLAPGRVARYEGIGR